jgi:hypothetical protein
MLDLDQPGLDVQGCGACADVLDWPVIEPPVCEECKGQGSTPKAYGDDRDKGRTFSTCPTCHGTGHTGPTFVVTREAFNQAEAIVLAACEKAHDDEVAHPSMVVTAVASALLEGLEVAQVVGAWSENYPCCVCFSESEDNTHWLKLNESDRIAILEPKEAK